MEIAAPSAVSMLPENNKTTALADSETVHQIAFLKPTSEDFGTKPPPRRGLDGLAVLRPWQQRVPGQQERRAPAAPWPGVLDPVLRHLDVHTIPDGGIEEVQKFAKGQIEAHRLQDNFYAVDLGRLHRLHAAFVAAMPRVTPFYAVKCNPDGAIMRCLAALGCGFDCASAKEMADVLAMGVPPRRIIFAAPCKRPTDLGYAVAAGVTRMTFDCESELDKIAEACPAARCVLRIRADDPSAIVQFGHKYGADPATEAPALLATAARLGLEVTGVSFHVGSGSLTPGTFLTAIEAARGVCDAGRAQGFDMSLLDIGGGFWGRFGPGGVVQLDAVAAAVNTGLERFFPASYGVEVIAEPGRFYAEACGTMHALVHTVKDKTDARGVRRRSYYITDGVYGSFNAMIYDHAPVAAGVLRAPGLPPPPAPDAAARVPSTVFGPTCDGVDLIFKDVPMPLLRRGDWLQFPNFGAYSIAGACAFNGLPADKPTTYYVWSKAAVGRLEGRLRPLRRGCAAVAEGTPEEELSFVAELHDLDSIC